MGLWPHTATSSVNFTSPFMVVRALRIAGSSSVSNLTIDIYQQDVRFLLFSRPCRLKSSFRFSLFGLSQHTVNNGTNDLMNLSNFGGVCGGESCAESREEVLLDGREGLATDSGLAKSPKARSCKTTTTRVSAIAPSEKVARAQSLPLEHLEMP